MEAKETEKQSPLTAKSFSSVSPEEFMIQIISVRTEFQVNQMADAQEFLTLLLDLLNQEANCTKKVQHHEAFHPNSATDAWQYHINHVDDSYLSDLLMGQLETTLTCRKYGHQSLSWNCFWQLQLQIDKVTPKCAEQSSPDKEGEQILLTLLDCIDYFTAEEVLNNSSEPLCSRCLVCQPANKRIIIGTMNLIKCTTVLTGASETIRDGNKIYRPVAINEQLNLANQGFVLSSAVLHRGNETVDHYFTLVREQDNKTWVPLGDNITKELSKAEAHVQTRRAYLCIYTRMTN